MSAGTELGIDLDEERELDLAGGWKGDVYFANQRLGLLIDPIHSAILEFEDQYRRTLLLGPRGMGKSLIGVTAKSLRKVLQDPNIRILMVSKSGSFARKVLRFSRHVFENNRNFRAVHGDWVGEIQWSEDELSVRPRTLNALEATLTALGLGGSLTGGHYDVIFADDVVDKENCRTPERREKIEDFWFTTVMPMLESWAGLHVSGTRYHRSDLYGRLLDLCRLIVRPIAWDGQGLRFETELSPKYKEALEAHQGSPEELDELFPIDAAMIVPDMIDEQSICPSILPLEHLRAERQALGPIRYAMQYRQEIVGGEEAIIRPEWLRWMTISGNDLMTKDQGGRVDRRLGEIRQRFKFYLGIDPSSGEDKQRGDYFAWCQLAIDPSTQDLFLLDVGRSRITIDEQHKKVPALDAVWPNRRIGIGAQAYEATLKQHLIRHTRLPIKPIKTSIDKVERAYALQPWFENGKVYLKDTPEMRSFVEELLDFPEVEYDDRVDAFLMAAEVAEMDQKGKLILVSDREPTRPDQAWARLPAWL